MTGQQHPAVAAQIGPGHHVVAHPLDVQPRAQPEGGLDGVGHRPSWWLTEGMATSAVASPSRPSGMPSASTASRHRSRRDAVVPEDVVELRLVVALALGEPLDDEHAGEEELAAGELAPARGLDGHRPRRARGRGRARRRSRRRSPGCDGLRMVPSPTTEPRPTRAPWVIMHRLPIMTSSSMTTGAAWAGSSTPPMPTPPERWTCSPIWAHDPTVAQVSTMEPAPTRAPMFT